MYFPVPLGYMEDRGFVFFYMGTVMCLYNAMHANITMYITLLTDA